MAKRRSNGEGNIRKRKDGRWEGRYTVGRDPVSGKQVFKNVLGKTQAEVKEKMKLAIEKSRKVDFRQAGKYTVTQWMDVWFENVCKLKVRPSSHQTYSGNALLHGAVSDPRHHRQHSIPGTDSPDNWCRSGKMD